MPFKRFALALALAAPLAAQAPEKIDTEMNTKLRTEEAERSKLMWIEHMLTDVYGPRPIGSPNHVNAANWAIKTMASWGMVNAHLEPFTWRGVGWLPGLGNAQMLTPVKANLKWEAVPWTPSIGGTGTIKGEIVVIIPPESPTAAELEKYLLALAPRVKGGIVMFGDPRPPGVSFTAAASRQDDAAQRRQYGLDTAGAGAAGAGGRGNRGGGGGGGGGAGGRGGRGNAGGAPTDPTRVSAGEVNARITALLRDNFPGLRLVSAGAGRIPGDIIAQNGSGGGGQIYDNTTPQAPSMILRADDYGRIWRIAKDGTPVTAEFSMKNTYYPEGKTSYITVAEIKGTDKADEVVIMGGHLDSWTSATGATDNAIGCAIMMEAARLLQTLGAKPRRTIRVALWSGEEEGLYGSQAYVLDHFGSAENPKPDFNKLVGYWNIDDGTGRVRGASIFGPPEAARILAQYIRPFEDWGMYGASASTSRSLGGSDNGAFAINGLPGIGTRQDNIEYNSTTWHTNLDTYERIIEEDVTHNAVLSASVVWHLANREQNLPRLAKDQMPALAAGGGGGGGAGGGGRGGRGAADSAAAPAAPVGPAASPHIFVAAKAKPFIKAAGALLDAGGGRGGGRAGGAGANPITAAVATKPAHGTLVLTAGGGFTYTPAAAFVGTDSFTYTLARGALKGTPATVTIVVK